MRAPLVGAVVLAVALLASLFAFGLGRDPTVLASAVVGKPAPPFALATLDGASTVSLAGLRGQVVVLNFWSSWCAECGVEHPALAAAIATTASSCWA
jgi:cytochrome c biogenesis protein CcmG/thiol:disulfide interchange protein DsbE